MLVCSFLDALWTSSDNPKCDLDTRRCRKPGREVGAVLEAAGFHHGCSGLDHLRVYCTACGYPPGRAHEVLELAGLRVAGRRKAGGYSLGMRQRLAMATALLGDPAVLVLDEPANGMDPEGIAWLRGLLVGYASCGRTVLFSSHALPQVEQLADQVVIVSAGRLAARGTLAELAADDGAVQVRTPLAGQLISALAAAGGRAVRIGPDSLRVSGMAAAEISRTARAQGLDLHELAAAAVALNRPSSGSPPRPARSSSHRAQETSGHEAADRGGVPQAIHHPAVAMDTAGIRGGRVIAGKLITYLIAGAGLALACIAVSLGVALPWLATRGIHVPPAGNGNLAVLAAVVARGRAALGALAGGQLADRHKHADLLVRRRAAHLPIRALQAWTVYLPGVAADGLTQATQAGVRLLAPWLGGVVFASWAAALSAAGTIRTIRTDIT